MMNRQIEIKKTTTKHKKTWEEHLNTAKLPK